MAYGDTLEIQKRLAGDFPSVALYSQELARTYNNLGLLLKDSGRPKEAEAADLEAVAIETRLVAQFPAIPDYQGA